MNLYKYILEPYNSKSKTNCPNCKEKNVFTRYIDTETKKYVHPTVGICDRALKCRYHLSPKDFFARGGKSFQNFKPANTSYVKISDKIDYLPKELVNKS